ncbi:sensor histidine kinase [Rickettsiella massiliensis]|uniref:sensor histidine kinase n=1 Tax=Rickettsiella massiliensis TaxID=676517 RepID=UPI002E1A0BEB
MFRGVSIKSIEQILDARSFHRKRSIKKLGCKNIVEATFKSSEFTGVGMGLYLVKQLLKDLKGTIALESELGKGSTFKLEIPLFI